MMLLALPAGAALGADNDSAREHFVKGTRAYDLGLYDEAIVEYMAAYRIKDDPALLFNLGQAHRLAGHPGEALRFYKTYLSKVPEAANRAEVEAKMAEMNRQIEQQRQPLPQPAPSQAPESRAQPTAPREASHADTPADVAPTTRSAPVPLDRTDEAPRPGRGLRISGIASAASGLALAGIGIVFGVRAKQAGDDLTQLDAEKGVFDPSKESAGQRDQLLAGVFIGVGAGALVTGAILYFLGARAGEEGPRAVVLPSVTAASAGATLQVVY